MPLIKCYWSKALKEEVREVGMPQGCYVGETVVDRGART